MSYKQTKYWTVDKDFDLIRKDLQIKEAALWIKRGELVAFPTETLARTTTDEHHWQQTLLKITVDYSPVT